MDKKAELILILILIILISIFNISVKKTHGYVTQCNSNYCLYSNLTSRQYTGIDDANRDCVQMNSSGWLLEVYDESLSTLVDNFISVYSRQIYNQYILMNVKTSRSWEWTNKATSNTDNIKNQEPIENVVAFLWRTNNNGQWNFEYNADTLYGGNRALCQINSPNCTMSSNWIYNPDCYIIIAVSYTWYAAENECIKRGGNLAVLDGLDLNVINKTWVQSWGYDSFWVGLSRLHYTWVKKDNHMTYSKWKTGYPSTDVNFICTAISPIDVNYWINVGCNGDFVAVCMTDNTIGIKTTTPSPTPFIDQPTISSIKITNPNMKNVSTVTVTFESSNIGSTIEITGTSPSKAPLIVGWIIAAIMILAFISLLTICIKTHRKLKSLENIQQNPTNIPSMNSTTRELDNTYSTLNNNNVEENRDYQGLNA